MEPVRYKKVNAGTDFGGYRKPCLLFCKPPVLLTPLPPPPLTQLLLLLLKPRMLLLSQ
jgi:hypothetical protein